MEPQPSHPVVICADSLRAVYQDRLKAKTLKAVLICTPFFILGVLLRMEWIGIFGILAVAGFVILPHVLRVLRFLRSIPCPACGLPAGKHETSRFILHLQCTHCGQRSRTDCMFFGPGLPTKVR